MSAPWSGGVRALAMLVGFVLASSAGAQPPLERQTLTGDWNGVRPALSARGFDAYLTYTGTMWANVGGGFTTGVRWNGYLDFGLDVDLAKLGAWDGLGFHADFHWWQGERPTRDLIGGVRGMALSDWEAAATLRVFNLYLRQSLDDDRIVVKLGQIAADTDFMVSRYAGLFVNSAFGELPSQSLNLSSPVYPLAAPGVFAQARVRDWLTASFGAYTANTGSDVAGNHGFDWEIGHDAGGVFFSELAVARQERLPGTYTLGGVYDTGAASPLATGFEPRSQVELYTMVDQALVADGNGDPVLAAFARVGGSPTPRSVVGIGADAGLAFFGPLPSRPQDMVGIAMSVFRFTDPFRATGRVRGGGQTVLEVTYQLSVTPWLFVQPDAQFFFEPAFSGRDAQAIGVEVVVIF